MNVLHICASPKPISESASKQLAAAFFAKLAEVNPDVNVTNVDLYQNPPPFLSYAAYRGSWLPVQQPGYTPTAEEKKALVYAQTQAKDFNEADILVLTMPLWGAGMPGIMKAWLDQVIQPGLTFTFDQQGAHSQHKLRKVILLVSSGAALKEGDPSDGITPQINAIFKFTGLEDINLAWADGQDPVMYSDCELRKKLALEAAQELAEEVADMAVV